MKKLNLFAFILRLFAMLAISTVSLPPSCKTNLTQAVIGYLPAAIALIASAALLALIYGRAWV